MPGKRHACGGGYRLVVLSAYSQIELDARVLTLAAAVLDVQVQDQDVAPVPGVVKRRTHGGERVVDHRVDVALKGGG
jgi:hypothetical protein